MPAAAVIPAPIMYAKIAAVEKSVVSTKTQYFLVKGSPKYKIDFLS